MGEEKNKPMFVDLEGKTALVTGGGTGIGRAISMALARCGCGVAVNYSKSKSAAEETVREIEKAGGRAMAVRADVTDEEQVKLLMAQTAGHFGGLDILVANAGGNARSCPTVELTNEDWERGLGLNCKSVFFCVKHGVPRFPDAGGRIIITS